MNTHPKRSKAPHRTLTFFPGALGDFLCFMPTAHALQRGSAEVLTIVAREEYRPLLDPSRFELVSIDRREIASLFQRQPGDAAVKLLGRRETVFSWTGAADENFPNNLSRLATGSAQTFPFRGFSSGEHAVQYFARCAGVEPVEAPVFFAAAAREWAHDLARRLDASADTLAIHAGSGGPAKNWLGMAALARWWREHHGPVVAIVGPADAGPADAGPADAGPATSQLWSSDCDVVVREQSIDRVAAILQRVGFFVGNDSGIAHLAGAVGCRGLVLFGDTDPAAWRPRGALRALHAPRICPRCGIGRLCIHRISVAQASECLVGARR